jgi:hypothetical protein
MVSQLECITVGHELTLFSLERGGYPPELVAIPGKASPRLSLTVTVVCDFNSNIPPSSSGKTLPGVNRS